MLNLFGVSVSRCNFTVTMRHLYILLTALTTITASAEDVEVRGTIRSLTNVPLPGVNVIVMGTAIGTVTDMWGTFNLSVPTGKITLLFSYLKQKPLEHSALIRSGYQYHVQVALAHKTQTFDRSDATTSELPLDCPRIGGRVRDEDGQALQGITIAQERTAFTSITGIDGTFDLLSPPGQNRLVVIAAGFKPLHLWVDLQGRDYTAEIVLIRDKRKNSKLKSFGKIGRPER